MGAAIRIELHVTADASLVEALAAMLSASTRDAATPGRDDGYVTVKELAAMLNVSERLIWSQVKTGAIQCIRIGRAVRIPRSSVNALLGEVSDG